MVQWLRICFPMQRDASAIPGWEQRSHIPQGHSAHVPQLERKPAGSKERASTPQWTACMPQMRPNAAKRIQNWVWNAEPKWVLFKALEVVRQGQALAALDNLSGYHSQCWVLSLRGSESEISRKVQSESWMWPRLGDNKANLNSCPPSWEEEKC